MTVARFNCADASINVMQIRDFDRLRSTAVAYISHNYVHCESNTERPVICQHLRQILTDFQSYFTVGFKIELATKQLSLFPPHFKHVANIGPYLVKQ